MPIEVVTNLVNSSIGLSRLRLDVGANGIPNLVQELGDRARMIGEQVGVKPIPQVRKARYASLSVMGRLFSFSRLRMAVA